MLRSIIMCFALAIATLSAIAQDTPMSTDDQASFKQSVRTEAQATKTITSTFTQYRHLDFMSNDIVSHGDMAYQAPNKVNWEYTSPFAYRVIFSDGKMKVDDDGKQSEMDISGNKLFMKLNDMMTKSVTGELFNDPEFQVAYFKSDSYFKLVLSPTDKRLSEMIASFELYFDKATVTVSEVKMIEPNADFTRIVFKDRKQNPALDDATFSF